MSPGWGCSLGVALISEFVITPKETVRDCRAGGCRLSVKKWSQEEFIARAGLSLLCFSEWMGQAWLPRSPSFSHWQGCPAFSLAQVHVCSSKNERPM